jgi:exonuclease III
LANKNKHKNKIIKSKLIKNLSCFYTNATSIQSPDKMNQFRALIASLEYPDLIFVCETWFGSNTINQIEGYQIIFKNRENDSHGGVAIYIKNGLEFYELEDSRFTNLKKSGQIWCILKAKKNEKIILGCIYRPPRADRETNLEINSTITAATELVSNKNYHGLLLTGDFNYSDIVWSDNGGECVGNGRASSIEFLDTIDSNFLSQSVTVPTFMNNMLDLIFTYEPIRIFSVNVGPPLGTSKADRLHATITWNYILNGEQNTSEMSKFLYAKGDFEAINKYLSDFNWTDIFCDKNADQMYEAFLLEYNQAISRFVPKFVKSNGFNAKKAQPKWFDKDIEKLTKEKYNLWAKMRASSKEITGIKTRYKQLSKEIITKVRKSQIDYERSIVMSAKKNPKLLYSYLKEQNKCKETIRSLVDCNGETIVDKDKISNCLNNCFVKVFSSCDDESSFPVMSQFSDKCLINSSELFSKLNVMEELKNLDTTKTMGADGIHPSILNKCANICSDILSIIYKKSYETGLVPTRWKEADLTPLPKSGVKTNPSNYRPISLTSVPCKVMERIIKVKMMDHLTKNNLIAPQQHGFVKKKSCLTNLIETLDFLTETLNRGLYAILIYLDFAKAFEKVSHKALIYKLRSYGFNEELVTWLIGFLTKRRQRVKIDEIFSEWREVLSGVPQGSVLGPLLFVIFINDMPKLVSNVLKLFADDSKLLAQIKNKIVDYKSIQKDLDSLVNWSNEWKMF